MRKLQNLLVTGGAGFIGTNFIRYLFNRSDFNGTIINVDKLTYAGNPENLRDIDARYGNSRYFFINEDICDFGKVNGLFERFKIDTVVHFAAESHVDRSIYGPEDFIRTNIMGTFSLLEAARKCWGNDQQYLFHHISTDEVYGSLGAEGFFTETTAYDPRSPYSASKASSDHLVMAYFHTYGLPVTVSNCSNNYGPYQFPEKLIPLMIMNMRDGKNLPVYGNGKNIRDWIYVEDHCDAIWTIINKSRTGENYNAGGDNEWENIALIELLCEKMAQKTGKRKDDYTRLITYVKDRPGHDARYAIDCAKIKKDLGWQRQTSFEEGLAKTVNWYLANEGWIKSIQSGEYRNWVEKNYLAR